ncbi:MAG: MoaD/ThiS family protein [Alphaproteobacteria bacterium]
MAQVKLGGTYKSYTGGRTEFDVEAKNIREILSGLAVLCPDLKPVLDKGVTVAIDGQIFRNAWFQPVRPDSEVHILPRMAGG